MPLSNVFKTSTAPDAVTDGSQGVPNKPGVSDFLTVQAFTNFAAMSGAITAAWQASQRLFQGASGIWFPYACAFLWAIISYLISRDGLSQATAGGKNEVSWGTTLQALFIAFINSLVLAGSVVGTQAVVTGAQALVTGTGG